MKIQLFENRQVTLQVTQNNEKSWAIEVYDCLMPVDISLLPIHFKIYDIFNNIIFDLPTFALSAVQSDSLRASKYRYTLSVGDFTYFFGDLLILAK